MNLYLSAGLVVVLLLLLLLGVVVPYAPPPPPATTTTASASAVSVLLLLGELWESTSCANLIDVDVTVFQELEYISKIGGGGGAAAWCICPKPRPLQPGTLLNRWQHCLLSNDATWISHPITYPC